MLIQFHYIHMLYNIVKFSIIMTIYRRNRHDYNYHNSYNIIIIILTIILFSCLISSLLLQYGQTALHFASRNGQHETVRTLLDFAVEKEAKDDLVRNDDNDDDDMMVMMLMMMMMMMMAQTMVNNNQCLQCVRFIKFDETRWGNHHT